MNETKASLEELLREARSAHKYISELRAAARKSREPGAMEAAQNLSWAAQSITRDKISLTRSINQAECQHANYHETLDSYVCEDCKLEVTPQEQPYETPNTN